MKRCYIVLLCALLGIISNAQNNYNLSLQGGVGYSNFRGDPISPEAEPQLNFVAGINVEKNLSSNLFIRTGLNYGKKAIETDVSFLILSDFDPILRPTIIETAIETLSLPVLLGYRSNGSIKVIASAGPFFSFVFNNENIISKSIDAGIMGTIGLEYGLGKGALRLEIIEELGLSNINDSQLDTQVNDDIRTNRLGIQLGYVIGF